MSCCFNINQLVRKKKIGASKIATILIKGTLMQPAL